MTKGTSRRSRKAVDRAKAAVDDASRKVESARRAVPDEGQEREQLESVQTDVDLGKQAVDRAARRTRRR